MAVSLQTTEQDDRNWRRLLNRVFPALLHKPPSRWTKDELWDAIKLYLAYLEKRRGGLLMAARLQDLGARLKGKSENPSVPVGRRRGRPPLMADEKYRRMYEQTEKLRLRIAKENGVTPTAVTDRQLSRHIAKLLLDREGHIDPPDYRVTAKARHCLNRIKAFKKKEKAREK